MPQKKRKIAFKESKAFHKKRRPRGGTVKIVLAARAKQISERSSRS